MQIFRSAAEPLLATLTGLVEHRRDAVHVDEGVLAVAVRVTTLSARTRHRLRKDRIVKGIELDGPPNRDCTMPPSEVQRLIRPHVRLQVADLWMIQKVPLLRLIEVLDLQGGELSLHVVLPLSLIHI